MQCNRKSFRNRSLRQSSWHILWFSSELRIEWRTYMRVSQLLGFLAPISLVPPARWYRKCIWRGPKKSCWYHMKSYTHQNVIFRLLLASPKIRYINLWRRFLIFIFPESFDSEFYVVIFLIFTCFCFWFSFLLVYILKICLHNIGRMELWVCGAAATFLSLVSVCVGRPETSMLCLIQLMSSSDCQ